MPSSRTKPAQPATLQANARMAGTLALDDRKDFEDAQRGFLGTIPDAHVTDAAGNVVWSMRPFAFLQQEGAPETVNPSLWRQARLNTIHGLFQVTDGVFQVRGFDAANMTLVEGPTGVIVVDPLMSVETARAALDLYWQHRPGRSVVAVIYTHNHVDHWGGVRGVVSDEDIRSKRVRIYAPEGFLEHAVSENIIVGNATSRRRAYQFGFGLPPGPQGLIDNGICKAVSRGAMSLIPPTDTITPASLHQTIDGVEFEFIWAAGSEADAEVMFYLPGHRVLNTAEVTSHALHQLYALRGAGIRDGNLWSRYIGNMLERHADRSDVLTAQHQWPVWGTDAIRHFLGVQRDAYKYLHDQTVRLLNHGYKPGEIAESLKFPPGLATEWSVREYYGTLKHGSRGVYQRYLGWYDGNPAHLDPLAPTEESRKYVEYMGGAQVILAKARTDFDKGEYRWVASVLSRVIFADATNDAARELCADAFEQLGYQAEAATWRASYLQGARELREGPPQRKVHSSVVPDVVKALPVPQYFDFLGIRLDSAKAVGKRSTIIWRFSDSGKTYRMSLANSALTWIADAGPAEADVVVTLTRAALDEVLMQRGSFADAVARGTIACAGSVEHFLGLFQLLDNFAPNFPIVEPRLQANPAA